MDTASLVVGRRPSIATGSRCLITVKRWNSNGAKLHPGEFMQGTARKGVGCARGIPPRLEQTMAKGQMKKSRENRKPKADKGPKPNASQPSLKAGAIKGLENMKNS